MVTGPIAFYDEIASEDPSLCSGKIIVITTWDGRAAPFLSAAAGLLFFSPYYQASRERELRTWCREHQCPCLLYRSTDSCVQEVRGEVTLYPTRGMVLQEETHVS